MNAPFWSRSTEVGSSQRMTNRIRPVAYKISRQVHNSLRYRARLKFPALMVPYYVYYLLLFCTPAAFRRAVGREILDHFYDAMVMIYMQEGLLRVLAFILYNVWDVLRIAVELRTEPIRNMFDWVAAELCRHLDKPHFIYYRHGRSSVRIALNRPIIDIRLRISYRGLLLMSWFVASVVTILLTATISGKLVAESLFRGF